MSAKTRSRLAWLGLGVFVVAVLFTPIFSARGSGHRELIVHFEGEPAAETAIRVATLLHDHAAHLLVDPPHPEMSWRWRAVRLDETDVKMEVTHGVHMTSSLACYYGATRYPYQDSLAVEYRTANEAPRFRVVSFRELRHVGEIELTIPREPPSDAEAWRPDVAASERGT